MTDSAPSLPREPKEGHNIPAHSGSKRTRGFSRPWARNIP